MHVSEVFIKAADYIDKVGLSHGVLVAYNCPEGAPVCLLGAIAKVTQQVPDKQLNYPDGDDKVVQALADYLNYVEKFDAGQDEPTDIVWSFNDQRDEDDQQYVLTASKASNMLRKAAHYVSK